jgi:hypothetical protein
MNKEEIFMKARKVIEIAVGTGIIIMMAALIKIWLNTEQLIKVMQ